MSQSFRSLVLESPAIAVLESASRGLAMVELLKDGFESEG
jgi:hypothetical protein